MFGGLPRCCAVQLRLLKSHHCCNPKLRCFSISSCNSRHEDETDNPNKSEKVELSSSLDKTESESSSQSETTITHSHQYADSKISLKKKLPGVKILRDPELKEIPDLRKNPVDRREIPRIYKDSDDAASSTNRAVGIFLETSRNGKNRDSFLNAINLYERKERVYKRGHVEFIYTAVKNLKDYEVEHDLAVYKSILNIFPKGPLLPKSKWQTMFMPYPKQQQCAIDVLCAMENNWIMPDADVGEILESVFSEESYAHQKYQRMMYWMGKHKYADPYPLPDVLPKDEEGWSSLVLKRMARGMNSDVTVWQTKDLEENPKEETYIASIQCERQKELLEKHPPHIPVKVEGGFNIWMAGDLYTYFKLKVESKNDYSFEECDYDDVSDLLDWSSIRFEERSPTQPSSYLGYAETPEEYTAMEEESRKRKMLGESTVHEQRDETIYAMCITGSGSKDSLVQWIRCLQKTNPSLENIPVLFSLKSQLGDSIVVSGDDKLLQNPDSES